MEKKVLAAGIMLFLIPGFLWIGFNASRLFEENEEPPEALSKISTHVTAFESSLSKYVGSLDAVDQKTQVTFYESGELSVETIAHRPRSVIGNKPFTRFDGNSLGINRSSSFSLLEYHLPFAEGDAIASGDVDNDGWTDLLMGTNKGIVLFKNNGGTFSIMELSLPKIQNLDVFVAALVDINNDGWLDIYVTGYADKNYFILNNEGSFAEDQLLEVPNSGALVTQATAFADIDKDGDLDFVNGNWFYLSASEATNTLILNNNLEFQEKDLQEINGMTLTVLLSDFTNDHNIDLLIGNDFAEPDIFYSGDGNGHFEEIRSDIIPVSTFFTMSGDSGDLNNDLVLDIYIGGLTKKFTTPVEKKPLPESCLDIGDSEEKRACKQYILAAEIISSKDYRRCAEISAEQDACMVMMLLPLIKNEEDAYLCDKMPDGYERQKQICMLLNQRKNAFYPDSIPQTKNRNVLLIGSENGKFSEQSEAYGVDNGFWTWNAKFADLDNDEWQDIYAVNGWWNQKLAFSNVFFHNDEGKRFTMEQNAFGLDNFLQTNAYTYTDIDNDGDLDIVSLAIHGYVAVFVNNNEKNSITFSFNDGVGNHFGIGNKIIISYGDSKQQIREMKSGGGFLSFDAPILHFGLGSHEVVTKVEIIWSTGEQTIIEEDFPANNQYTFTRSSE